MWNSYSVSCLTARGDELTARHEYGSGLASYRRANDLAVQHTIPVLGLYSRGALARASENS